MDPPTQGESISLGKAQDISFIKEFLHSSQRAKEPLTMERVLETSTREQEERVAPSEVGKPPDLRHDVCGSTEYLLVLLRDRILLLRWLLRVSLLRGMFPLY